jgi:putative endonuclease
MSREMSMNGVYGEICAARYLREHGYTIRSANYRCRMGEIDIVAEKKGTLVFAEVKTRGLGAIASAAESVGREKQRRLSLTAAQYMQQRNMHKPSRFDVLEVYLDERGEVREIRHIEDAFDSRFKG